MRRDPGSADSGVPRGMSLAREPQIKARVPAWFMEIPRLGQAEQAGRLGRRLLQSDQAFGGYRQ